MTSNVQLTPPPDRNWIVACILHSGAICLLNTAVVWDDAHIRYNAAGYRGTTSPLRSHDQLAAVCGVECATQTMAVHSALCDTTQACSHVDLLASARNIEAHALRLDTVEALLDVEVERTGGDDINVLYHFTVRSDARILLIGHTVVVLDASVA